MRFTKDNILTKCSEILTYLRQSKYGFLAIIFCFSILFSSLYPFNEKQGDNENVNLAPQETAKKIFDVANRKNLSLKDPFSTDLSQEEQNYLKEAVKKEKSDEKVIATKVKKSLDVVLTGILKNSQEYIAIIKTNERTISLKKGDFFNDYQVNMINNNSISFLDKEKNVLTYHLKGF